MNQIEELSRATLYMHHITAPWKKRFIREALRKAGLTGLCLFGKPGRILLEGPTLLVKHYAKIIKSWPWKICSLQGPWIVSNRCFDSFKEMQSSNEFREAVLQAGSEVAEELQAIRSVRN